MVIFGKLFGAWRPKSLGMNAFPVTSFLRTAHDRDLTGRRWWISEIGPYRFTPGEISRNLMNDYSAEVQPKHAIAAE